MEPSVPLFADVEGRMPGTQRGEILVIEHVPRPDYEALRAAVHDAAVGRAGTPVQQQVILEVRECRALLSSPLNPQTERLPKHEDRNRIAGLAEVTVAIAPDRYLSPADAKSSTIRLGADLVSVATALSDELQINELDAGVLLYDARTQAAHRADHDVVAAAKELFYLRRRESVLYLQEIIRAGLMASTDASVQDEESFISVLMRERDMLAVEHNVVTNVQKRLVTAFSPASMQSGPKRNRNGLQKGEFVLLAETLFLLAYTIQLSSSEALALRSLLDQVDDMYEKLLHAERDAARAHRPTITFAMDGPAERNTKGCALAESETMSPHLVELESVRNLIFLAWTCALDRSRYHDIYDPRTGVQGVNLLLKDLGFISRTCTIPKLDENEGDDKVGNLSRAKAAAELCASVFRLAVANPDEDEALWTALRVSAYGSALSFLSNELASWIGKRAGSLGPDADLYADVVEDLALDVAEAPQLVTSLINFTQNEVIAAATETAYASVDGGAAGFLAPTRNPRTSPGLERNSLAPSRTDPASGSNRRVSTSSSGLRGKPPRPPNSRVGGRPPTLTGNAFRSGFGSPGASFGGLGQQIKSEDTEVQHNLGARENLIASLARFVAEAVSLAPSKLAAESIGGGARYWSGIGLSNAGLIPQIGDAVIDLWDASMRNPYAAGGVGDAFRDALNGFLHLLASSARKEGSPSHAASALRFLRDSGQSAVSLERASDAMSHFHTILSSPTTPQGAQLDAADVDALQGIIDVIANAAETLRPHGGVMHLLGDPGKELAMRMASLAVDDVRPSLKASLLKALSGLDNRRAISLFLETVAVDKASPLRRFLRGAEAQTGTYDMTIGVLNLTSECMSWSNDEFPETAIESITSWFATEEVLTYWSRRKYMLEAHRWRLVRAAATLISDVVHRNPTSERSFRILARLLTPAPGTGAASYALRTLICAAGLMRAGDEKNSFSEMGSSFSFNERQHSLYHVSGRDSLIHAAEHGLGDSYREMQLAAQTAARIISLVLSVPPGRIAVPGIVVAPASELLLGEVKAISSAASLVFAVNGFIPSISRAGFGLSVCAAVLGMLAKAAQESAHIAVILARDAPGSTGSAAQFRASLANIISRSTTEESDTDSMDDKDGNREAESKHTQDPPIMHSALRIVEASLGIDGGSAPGMFLLGLQLDSSGLYSTAEYGVLGALVELVAGAHDPSGRVDDKCRSTAATFLERLAAHTVRRTSLAVLEHLKEVAHPDDPNVRGGGFADEMLFRILEAVGTHESTGLTSEVDWAALGELLTACMSLSALQVRLFPKYEVETSISRARTLRGPVSNGGAGDLATLPSPIDLLKLLSLMAGAGQMQIAFEALRTWCHLLGVRLGVHERNSGYSSVPLLFELTHILLGALSGSDGGSDLAGLVKKDGGEMASSIILLCIARMRDCDNPHEPGSEEYIGDVQCTALLTCVVQALAGVVGIGANASRARTSLYAALMVCASLARTRVSDDAIGRAFGGRHGPRQISGTEAVVSAACADAVSGPTAASKAAAMAAASLTTILDPVRSMPALGTQNRLRRVIHGALGDPAARKLISRACTKPPSMAEDGSSEPAQERAAIVVAEAAIALIHAVSSAAHGARIIADSGCIESAASLLPHLKSPRFLDYGDIESDLLDRQQRSRRAMDRGKTDVLQRGTARHGEDDRDQPLYGNNGNRDAMGIFDDRDIPREGDNRVSMIASVTSALAAAICCANATVVDCTLVALDEAKNVFSDLLRGLRSPRSHHLEAVSSLGVIISRIPYDLLTAAASATQLRMSLASVVGAIIPPVSKSYQIGSTGSAFSAGTNLRRPESHKEAQRVIIAHPEGGSLLERDLISSRAACAQNVIAALRCPAGLLFLFEPRLLDRSRAETCSAGASAGSDKRRSEAIGRLSEIVRICRAALSETQRSAEESMQIDTRLAGETGTSISSRRVSKLSDFCREEFGIEQDALNGQMVIECLKKTSSASRKHTDTCISIFEGCLFILREYVRTARETVRGNVPLSRSTGLFDNGEGDGVTISFADSEALLSDGKNVLVPICKGVEALAGGVWGSKDASFCKQLCRQIRTACTGRG